MRIAVLGGRELVYGFRLAGIDAHEVEPGDKAEQAFDRLAAAKDIAIIILSRRLFHHLRDRIGRLRARKPLPTVVALPERGEKAEPEDTSAFLKEYLGLKV